MKKENIAGIYGNYELVFASEEAICLYFEKCLENIDSNEMHEAWQLYHLCIKDVLEKVFLDVKEGRCKAYFLLYHSSKKEKEVLGIGGFGQLRDVGENVGEIWFMGKSFFEHKRFLVQYGREIIEKILTHYPTVLNIAAIWNDGAFKIVKFLGFTVKDDAIRAGVDNALFKCFFITRK